MVWKCECECGSIGEYRLCNLGNGHTKSCGCLGKKKFRSWMEEPPEIDGKSSLIPLTKGKWAIIDKSDFEVVSKFTWSCSMGYAITGDRMVRMHRKIFIASEDIEVDHRNGNKLDNRRENLRSATHQQNGMNRGPQSNNKSGVKGVCWDRFKMKWRAQIGVMGKNVFIGSYDNKFEAAEAYKNAAMKFHGEFARTA